MAAPRAHVALRAGERAYLERCVRAATTPQRVVWRSRIVLLALDGVPTSKIASRLGVSRPTVRLWLRRFVSQGASSLLRDAPRRGRRPLLDPTTMMAWLREAHLLDRDGKPTSLRAAGRRLGVSPATVWRALQKLRKDNS
jgi:biotin operon repressor